jgi:hypothetical protein
METPRGSRVRCLRKALVQITYHSYLQGLIRHAAVPRYVNSQHKFTWTLHMQAQHWTDTRACATEFYSFTAQSIGALSQNNILETRDSIVAVSYL